MFKDIWNTVHNSKWCHGQRALPAKAVWPRVSHLVQKGKEGVKHGQNGWLKLISSSKKDSSVITINWETTPKQQLLLQLPKGKWGRKRWEKVSVGVEEIKQKGKQISGWDSAQRRQNLLWHKYPRSFSPDHYRTKRSDAVGRGKSVQRDAGKQRGLEEVHPRSWGLERLLGSKLLECWRIQKCFNIFQLEPQLRFPKNQPRQNQR